MKKLNFLVCYDISCHKRLQKVARVLSKIAIRIQKSIFLCIDCIKEDITQLVDTLNEIIDKDHDDIRIYKIDINNSLNLKSGLDLKNPSILFKEI